MSVDTERVRKLYDKSAARYDRKISVPERLLFGSGRQWAAGQGVGRTLEVAAGTGRNLPYYKAEVSLTAVDLSAAMLDLAQRRAAGLGRDVEFSVADAQALPFETAHFDTVVATLALCSIPDDRAGVAEMAQVLKPGGRLVLLDHVRSPIARFAQCSARSSRCSCAWRPTTCCASLSGEWQRRGCTSSTASGPSSASCCAWPPGSPSS